MCLVAVASLSAPAVVAEGEVVAVERVRFGSLGSARVELDDGTGFLVPGDGFGARPAGMPPIEVGRRYRVELVAGADGWTPMGIGAGVRALDPPRFALNGVQYRSEDLPRRILFHEGSDDPLFGSVVESVLVEALRQWTEVGCSAFAFRYEGGTERSVAQDGENVVAFASDAWPYDPAAAAATIHYFDTSGALPVVNEADLLLNGVAWHWVDGPGDVRQSALSLNAVLTHELGHVTGMGHDMGDPTTTMHFAYFGGDWQETLAGDDRRGLCENYPNGLDECVSDDDCAGLDGSERLCAERDGVFVCEEVRDPLGSECSIVALNCASHCVFPESTDLDHGFCTEPCGADADCPDGWRCGEALAFVPVASEPARVCLPLTDDPAVPDDPPDEHAATGCGCRSGPPVSTVLLLLPILLASRPVSRERS